MLAVAAVVAAGVWLVVRDGGGADASSRATFRGEGYRFSYPDRWSTIEGVRFRRSSDGSPADVTVGLDRSNRVSVGRQPDRLDGELTPEELPDLVAAADERFTDQVEREDGVLLVRPRAIERGDLLGFELVVVGVQTEPVEARIVGLFEGGSLYVVSCRHRSAAPFRVEREIDRGCETVLESLQRTDA